MRFFLKAKEFTRVAFCWFSFFHELTAPLPGTRETRGGGNMKPGTGRGRQDCSHQESPESLSLFWRSKSMPFLVHYSVQKICKKSEEIHKESENRMKPVLHYLQKIKNYWANISYSKFQHKYKTNSVHCMGKNELISFDSIALTKVALFLLKIAVLRLKTCNMNHSNTFPNIV